MPLYEGGNRTNSSQCGFLGPASIQPCTLSFVLLYVRDKMMIICLFADLSNSVFYQMLPWSRGFFVLSSVGGQLDCGRPLRHMMYSQLQEKMCQASNNAQLSLRVTSRQRKQPHIHDLHFCVRNCLSWVYELNGFLPWNLPCVAFRIPLYFPLGSHSIPCSALTPSSNCLVFTLVFSFLLRETYTNASVKWVYQKFIWKVRWKYISFYKLILISQKCLTRNRLWSVIVAVVVVLVAKSCPTGAKRIKKSLFVRPVSTQAGGLLIPGLLVDAE